MNLTFNPDEQKSFPLRCMQCQKREKTLRFPVYLGGACQNPCKFLCAMSHLLRLYYGAFLSALEKYKNKEKHQNQLLPSVTGKGRQFGISVDFGFFVGTVFWPILGEN